MRFWKLALLTAVGLALSTAAFAGIYTTSVKSDTLALYSADSSVVIDVGNAARLWLDIIAVPLTAKDTYRLRCDTTYVSVLAQGKMIAAQSYAFVKMDSTCTAYNDSINAITGGQADSVNAVYKVTDLALAVQAREVLSSAAGTDSTYAIRLAADAALTDPAYSATIQYNREHSTAAAYSDSTVIPWNPRTWRNQATTFASDTFVVNVSGPRNSGAAGNEIHANILANNQVYSDKRSVRIDLVSPDNGAPFRAQFASFRWRLIGGPAGYSRFRVVLGRETW